VQNIGERGFHGSQLGSAPEAGGYLGVNHL
jgi:hypothetical protein